MSEGRDFEALIAFIDCRQDVPFDWKGGADCVAYAAAAVAAMTGRDARGNLRWKNRSQALRLIGSEGGIAMALSLRFDQIPCALASRGDIAGVEDNALGMRLMIIEGDTLVGPGEHGNERLPRAAMAVAWDATSFGLGGS